MTKKQKKALWRLCAALAAFIFACLLNLFHVENLVVLAAFLLAYVLAGGDVVYKAVRNILHGQVFDENFLMSLATIGAFFVGEYPEGVAVMLFYQVGEWFQSYAVGKSRRSISDADSPLFWISVKGWYRYGS